MVMPGDDAKFTVKLITPIAMSEKLNFAIRKVEEPLSGVVFRYRVSSI